MFAAFQRLKRGSAKLLFSPNVAGLPGASAVYAEEIGYFANAAHRSGGDIAIWPFFVPNADYRLLLRGASFLLMPSLYEPFGAASEGYAAGTPVVARGTGGLWMQVVPLFRGVRAAFLRHAAKPGFGFPA